MSAPLFFARVRRTRPKSRGGVVIAQANRCAFPMRTTALALN